MGAKLQSMGMSASLNLVNTGHKRFSRLSQENPFRHERDREGNCMETMMKHVFVDQINEVIASGA